MELFHLFRVLIATNRTNNLPIQEYYSQIGPDDIHVSTFRDMGFTDLEHLISIPLNEEEAEQQGKWTYEDYFNILSSKEVFDEILIREGELPSHELKAVLKYAVVNSVDVTTVGYELEEGKSLLVIQETDVISHIGSLSDYRYRGTFPNLVYKSTQISTPEKNAMFITLKEKNKGLLAGFQKTVTGALQFVNIEDEQFQFPMFEESKIKGNPIYIFLVGEEVPVSSYKNIYDEFTTR